MTARPPRPGIPTGIWVLGFVSLLMDVSSEMIHSLLPVFLVGSLGASVTRVGVIEGVAEATALVVKVFSGALSDFVGRRKPLAVAGLLWDRLGSAFTFHAGAVFAGVALQRRVVLDAAVHVVADRGFAGATIDAIASRSVVARSTIYRTWQGRTDLLPEAVRSPFGPLKDQVVGEGDTIRSPCAGDLCGGAYHRADDVASWTR